MRKYKYKKRTATEVQKLIERYEKGETLKQIGQSEDLSRERIRQLFVKVNHKRRGSTISEEVRQAHLRSQKHLPRVELERLYVDEKKSAREIGEILHCHPSLVYVNLKRYNIPRRSHSELNNLNPLKYPLMTRENLYRWYIEEKKPVQKIAEDVGCRKITVYKKLNTFGIKKTPLSKSRSK